MSRGLATIACDLLVIGAGPAGLAAATRAMALGPDTVLVDEQPVMPTVNRLAQEIATVVAQPEIS